MKPLTSKQMVRLEKKKKKMEAFLEIAKLNDRDREAKQNQLNNNNNSNEESDTSSQLETGPSPKRLKSGPSPDEETAGFAATESENVADENEAPVDKTMPIEVQYAELKRRKRERNKFKLQPRLRLKEMGTTASLATDPDERIPIFLGDVQSLLMYSVLGHHSPYSPSRWCHIDKFNRLMQTVVLVVENVSLNNYLSYESMFPFVNANFEIKLEVVTPTAYRGDVVEELATIPLTSTQKSRLIKKYGNLESAAIKSGEVFHTLRAVFPIKEKLQNYRSDDGTGEKFLLPPTDNFPRTQILLSAAQLVEENFPLPLQGCLSKRYSDYVLTKDEYDEVTPFSPMYGLDCEMCRTTAESSELTRISIVNEKMELIYEKYVKPRNKIIDYLTRFSGITPEKLENVTTRLEDVQEDIRELLPADAILIGQSLNSDLHAMKMMHPYVIDTSVIFNITGERFRKTKLQTLAREFLCETIQTGRGGHSSIEDSLSAIKLVQLKLTKNIEFGDAVLCGKPACERHIREIQTNNTPLNERGDVKRDASKYVGSMFSYVTRVDHTATVVGCADVTSHYKDFVMKPEDGESKVTFETVASNKEVIKKACESFKDNSLTLAHIKLTNKEVADDNASKTYRSVNKWVNGLWNGMSPQSLCVVVFTGQDAGASGLCCLQIKKTNKQL